MAQGKTSKKLRIQLTANGGRNDLGAPVDGLIKQRKIRGALNPFLMITKDSRKVAVPIWATPVDYWATRKNASLKLCIDVWARPSSPHANTGSFTLVQKR